MEVREARAEDAEAFAAVVARVAEEGLIGAEPPVDVGERAARFRELIEGGGPGRLFVLEASDGVIGGAGVHSTRARGVLSLGMVILPQFRGSGGGRALLRAAIDHARGAGAHKLELEVWPDNAGAIALYSSAGFAVEGVRRLHYRRRDGELRSAVVMALLLDPDEPERPGQSS